MARRDAKHYAALVNTEAVTSINHVIMYTCMIEERS